VATASEIRQAISDRLAVLWPQLVSRQNAYFAAHGRYWQGVRNYSADPADGATAPADQLAARPTDQAEDWAAFGVATWTEAFSLEVHVYDGPAGPGWVACSRVTLGGRTWERWKGQGPEARDRPWAEVTAA
jgi:hypothetical protein